MSGNVPRVRLGVLAVVIVSLFAALTARLYYLQVLVSPTFVVEAERNQVREVRIPPVRGRILDRNGAVLADNELIGEVALDRDVIAGLDDDEVSDLFVRLGDVIGLDADEVEGAFESPSNHPLLPAVVMQDVDRSVLTHLKERQREFPGVIARQVHRRIYPLGPVASHLVGYVGEIPPGGLNTPDDSDYAPGDEIGKAGVERIFESDLRGGSGSQRLEVDRREEVVGVIGEPVPAVPGSDVHLTIDIELQKVAETALENGLLNARRNQGEFNARMPAPAGSVVVLDSVNGSVLAMASYPYYDPNDFVGGIATRRWDILRNPASYAPLNNRAIQGLYAPGSTFKLFTAIAGLESEVINLGTGIDDGGEYELVPCEGDKCVWRNAGSVPYGWVNLTDSLIVSSDVYYYSIGADIQRFRSQPEDEAIQSVAERYGFGEDTGVQLPFELGGRVPDEEWKENFFEDGLWLVGDNINLAIGQGDLVVTPLQLANGYATFARSGVRHQPNIADRVVDRRTGELVREIGPRVVDQVRIEAPDPAATYESLLAGLVGAVNNGRGTARDAFRGFGSDFTVAGKTGTAQQFGRNEVTGRRKEDTAVFVGFAPFHDPRYVVAVVMEESGFGGAVAAPVAREVFEAVRELDRTGRVSPRVPEADDVEEESG